MDSTKSTSSTSSTHTPTLQSPVLGIPLPLDEHACSVAMPKWDHVVGYEEGDEAVANALACGYPRFVYHPYLQSLMTYALDEYSRRINSDVLGLNDTKETNNNMMHDCILMPSKAAANR